MGKCNMFCAAILIVSLAGCQQRATPEAPAVEPPKVTVASPIEVDLLDWTRDFVGYLQSRDAVTLRSQVGGLLQAIHVDDGAEVKKGDLLMEIDPRMYEAAVASTKAALAQANARANQMKAELDRTLALRPSGAATQSDEDAARANHEESVAQIDIQKSALRQAELNLEYTKIVAPMDGVMNRHQTSVGDLVTPNTTPLIDMVSINPMDGYFTIDENTLRSLQKAIRDVDISQDVEIPTYFQLVDEMNGSDPDMSSYRGIIRFFSPTVNSSTGTIRVWMTVDNPRSENGHREFASGMCFRTRVPLGTKQKKILVPESAIGSNQSLKYLLAVDADNTVRLQIVELGEREGLFRVIRSGIMPTDRIIINGLLRARPGAKVMPESGTIEPPSEETKSAE